MKRSLKEIQAAIDLQLSKETSFREDVRKLWRSKKDFVRYFGILIDEYITLLGFDLCKFEDWLSINDSEYRTMDKNIGEYVSDKFSPEASKFLEGLL